MNKIMTYRKEIDGLRAIAVVPVILFHAGFELFSGGYVGVDIFFVISGFLITTILMKELDHGTFSVKAFYERRVRRLLPALFVVMLFTAIAGWKILVPSDFLDFCESIIAVVFCGSNFLFWTESSYWDTASELKPLLHTWSLAVEEQYYILFPPFLYVFYRWSKKATFGMILGGLALSLLGAEVLVHFRPSAGFFLLPSRGWEMLIGSVAAYLLAQEGLVQKIQNDIRKREILSIVGMAMILSAIFGYDSFTPNPSFMMLLPTLGTFLIILFCSKDTVVGKVLSLKPLVVIGLISYSAYLWHQPIFSYTRYVAFPEQSKWLFGALSVGVMPLAYLTWKYVENPFRNKERFSAKFIFSAAAICSALFLAFGFAGYATKGFAARGNYQALLIRDYEPDKLVLQKESWEALRTRSNDADYKVAGNPYDQELWYDLQDSRPKLLLVGNSHCKDLYNVLSHSKTTQAKVEIARFGVEIHDALKVTTGLLEAPNYQNADYVMICSRYNREDSGVLESVVKRFLSDGKKVAVVRNIYEFETFGNSTLADKIFQSYAKKLSAGEVDAEEVVDAINEEHYKQIKKRKLDPSVLKSQVVIDSLAASYNVTVLDRMDYAIDVENQSYRVINEEFQKYNFDGTHHSVAGARYYGGEIDKIKWLNEVLK